MAGGLSVSVRQIASYPAATIAPQDLLLVQQAGPGGPYVAAGAYQLIRDALGQAGPLGVGTGFPAPAAADPSQIFVANHVLPDGGAVIWNAYWNGAGFSGWNPGPAFWQAMNPDGVMRWSAGSSQAASAEAVFTTAMQLTPAGNLSLPRGTLTVARDPASAFDVATLGWVGANTVASFNNRRGVVTLQSSDIYGALGICPPDCIATTSSVDQAICAAINDFIRTYPSVWSWMGRVGDVFLTVADMNYAAANNPAFMPPLTIPEPPLTATDGEVITASWVLGILSSNPPGYATEAWVQNYVAQNAVTSFNGRLGAVNLTLADIQGAGGAPIASPAFSGVPSAPTAAPGSNTGQLATTAFVQAAISGATAGVASFNGRTGTVVLTAPDVSGVGGLINPSAALTGTPTAPTAAVGNSSTQIATTAFVTAAVSAAGGVTSFNTRTGAITFVAADISGAGGALLASPAFTGTPTAPTAAAGTNNTELATTAFVNAAISSIGIGVTSFEGRTGAVTLLANDISAAGGLINPSVALTGVPTAPTAAAGTSSTQIATTAFVGAAILAGSVTTFNGRAGAVTLSAADISGAGGALLASPSFTGVPVAPTAAPGTNTTQLATTAFVTSALTTQAANSVTSFNGRQGVVTLTTADITGAGGAPIASPTFTGVPAVPTATAGTSTTQAASTAFVMAAIAASTAGVTSFNSRTGAVTLQANDVSAVGGALLASPQFTGTPTAPTPTAGDNSTNIATTAFVQHALLTAAVQSFNGRTGVVTLQLADVTGVGGAPAASPAFSGTPTAPTATAGTSTTQLATTAFVQAAVGGYLPLTGGTLTGNLTLSGTANLVVGGTVQTNTLTPQSGTLTLNGAVSQSGLLTANGGINTTNINTTTLSAASAVSVASAVTIGNRGINYAWVDTNQITFQWTAQSSFNTYVNGTFTGAFAVSGSDPRLKSNIAAPSVDALAVVNQISLQQFDLTMPQSQPQHWNVGFLSDQLKQLIPEAVLPGSAVTLPDGESLTTYDTVMPLPLVAYLAAAVQRLVLMVQQLQGAVGILQQNANLAETAWDAV